MNNFFLRTLTGILYVVALVGCTIFSPATLVVFFALATALSIWEFSTNVNNHAGAQVNRLINSVAGVCLVLAVAGYCSETTQSRHFIPYLFTLLYLLINELYRKQPDPLKNWAYAFASQLYIALSFSMVFVLAFRYDAMSNRVCYEWIYPLAVFIFLWVSDTGAYLCGCTLSRYFPAKLFERISPKKSWVGSIGGGLLCLAAAWGIYAYEPQYMTLWQWMGLALTVCVFGTWGDLVESLLKRQVGIKDSGTILPGHGGLLDRFDSALLAIPAAAILSFAYNEYFMKSKKKPRRKVRAADGGRKVSDGDGES
jgi:phosphatidate cytidylyltransferase